MIEIVLVVLVGGLNLLAFFMGAKITQKVYEKEKLEVRIESKEERQFKKEKIEKNIQKEKDMEKSLRNLDSYNGDEIGQEDF